jgi:hypothetical protein
MLDGFATRGKSTKQSSTKKLGSVSNASLHRKRKRGGIPAAVPSLFSRGSSRMSPSHAAKGGRRWRYYISRAILKGRNSDAVPSRESLRPRSRSRCSTRSKASSDPNVRTRVLALRRFLIFPGGWSARPGNHAKRYPVMRTYSTRSSESRLARRRSRSCSASPSSSMA